MEDGTRARLRAYLEEHQSRHIERIRDFLRQPSVPSEGLGVEEGARLLARYYQELGCREVELIRGAGYPGVFAYYDAGASKTLVSYAMFDTKPADHLEWGGDPFRTELVEMSPFGRAVVAPGAKARKGPYIQFLNALEALKAVEGALPVNIVFLAEGEENLGSPHYREFVERYRDRVSQGDACHCPGAAQAADGTAEIHLGFKGLLYVRLRASGQRSARGPQAAPSHGMAQVIVDSPVWRLIGALSTLTADDGRAITIDGFYDDYRPPTEEERAEVRELVARYRDRPWQRVLPGIGDAKTSRDHLDAEQAFLRYMYEPGCNVNGLAAGYTGPGSKVFTLPHEAEATMDIRVPRGFSTARTADRLSAHLERRGYGDIEVEVLGAHEPMRTRTESHFVGTVLEMLAERGLPVVLWPTTGGGGPWSIMAVEFGMPVLFDVGLGHGSRAGSPGEFLVLDGKGKVAGLVNCELFYAELLKRWAAAPPDRVAAAPETPLV